MGGRASAHIDLQLNKSNLEELGHKLTPLDTNLTYNQWPELIYVRVPLPLCILEHNGYL